MHELQGQIRDYSWGSVTAIPELLGSNPTGQPQAEYWLGGHPLAPATMGGTGLDQVFVQSPDLFGSDSDRYPVLMKILAADHPLSLQAHPNKDQAKQGFAQESAAQIPVDAPERVYRDNWPKPEILVALSDFHALCGFRAGEETVQLFDQLGVSPGLREIISPLEDGTEEGFTQVFSTTLTTDRLDYVDEVVHLAHHYSQDDTDLGLFAQTALELNHFFPRQPSILAALLLNRIHLEPGQGLFVPTRTLHSYLSGVGIEVMACSDNVLRGGLTKKHVNVEQLMQVVEFQASTVQPVETIQDHGFVRYITQASEFTLYRGDLSSESVDIPQTDSGRIALVVEGEAQLSNGNSTIDLTAGQAVLIPYGDQATAQGSATIFVGVPGASHR